MDHVESGYIGAGDVFRSACARNDVRMEFGLSDREASDRFVTPNESLAHLIAPTGHCRMATVDSRRIVGATANAPKSGVQLIRGELFAPLFRLLKR